MLNLGILHPITVHFPVVLFTIALVLDALRSITKYRPFFLVSHWTIIVGTCFLAPTVLTGFSAANRMPPGDFHLNLHRNMAIVSLIFSFFHCALRVYSLRRLHRKLLRVIQDKWFLIVSAVNMVLITITGDLGGYLTHGEPPFIISNKPQSGDIRKDPYHVRFLSSEDLDVYLEKQITFEDILPVFEKYSCEKCHRTQYPVGGKEIDFSHQENGDEPWLERNEDGAPKDWKHSIFYEVVILKNEMPIDEEKKAVGISEGDRLLLLQWLKNGAPKIDVIEEDDKVQEGTDDNEDWLE